MKILWISHLIPFPPKGGVLQRSYNLIKELSKYNEVHVVAFNQRSLLPNDEDINYALSEMQNICASIKSLPIECEKVSLSGKYRVAAKSFFTDLPYTINWLQSSKMANIIDNEINDNTYDVVHYDTISLAPFCDFNKNVKNVLNHHNIESNMLFRRAENERNIPKKIYFYQEAEKLEKYEQKICKNFDLNITCSHVDSVRLHKIIGSNNKITDIPNGVDVNYFYPQNSIKISNSLCFCGGMSWYPNRAAMVFFANKVWPILTQQIPGITMRVIGKSPPVELLDLAKKDSNFIVTGFLDDMRPIVDQSMLYVCPISDGGGTKIKILDALAMGKAIIANPISCEGIDVVNGENIIFAEKPEDYVEKIKTLLNKTIEVERIGANGRELVERKYSYIEIGKKINKTYIDILKKDGSNLC